MNRYLLLILLSSWSLLVTLSNQCDTGVARPNRVLSVPKSLMANADVAVLKKYSAKTVEKCLEDCCVKKYGGCNVASFKKISTKENCLHFYCLPSNKCVFASSNTTDSFSFSSESHMPLPVPFSNAHLNSTRTSTNISLSKKAKQHISAIEQQIFDHEQTKEKVATYSEEQFAMKNDNTTIKPRKGVENIMMDDILEENTTTRSGIKPRKGVNMEDAPELGNVSKAVKSKVKPRKGVGNYSSTNAPIDISSTQLANKHIVSTQLDKDSQIISLYHTKVYTQDVNLSSDLISALEKVFEDDPSVSNTTSTSTAHSQTVAFAPSTQYVTESMTGSDIYTASSSGVNSFSLQSSLHSEIEQEKQSSSQTPVLEKSSSLSMSTTRYFDYTLMPSIPKSLHVESASTLEFLEDDVVISPSSVSLEETVEESENERKYKSSMHLVLSLVFGLLVLFAVLGVVAKRIYDGWLRRHYRRMDFLIDGMYNGYE